MRRDGDAIPFVCALPVTLGPMRAFLHNSRQNALIDLSVAACNYPEGVTLARKIVTPNAQELIKTSRQTARAHFMKGSSYFNADFPSYINFEPILNDVDDILTDDSANFGEAARIEGVNYEIIANKDGRLSWRPLEMIHPVIYVTLVNVLCDDRHWKEIKDRFRSFQGGVVQCCSRPLISTGPQSDKAEQVRGWWKEVEQESLKHSLTYSHLLHTDITNCYGSLYTHSIAWALHGQDKAKQERHNKDLLGNKIDFLIRSGRWGQTNGIPQGSGSGSV